MMMKGDEQWLIAVSLLASGSRLGCLGYLREMGLAPHPSRLRHSRVASRAYNPNESLLAG